MTQGVLRLWIVVVTILLHQYTYAADQETWVQIGNYRYHASNGRAWTVLDAQAKITFLVGIENGLALVPLQMQTEKRIDKSINDAHASSAYLTISGFRFGDLVSQVDSFYSDTANLKIPVIEAYRYVIKKMKGATSEELATSAANLRRIYNQ